MRGLPEVSLPSIKNCMEANLIAAKLVNPDVRFAGIALNTVALDDHETSKIIKELSQEFGLITCDPMKHGVDDLIEFLLQG